MDQQENKSYQPSNGSEGEYFMDQFCYKCKHMDPNPEGEKQCEILMRSMSFSIDEPEYPKEWIYDKDNNPTCTKHEKWDWEKNGIPKKEIPINPNQLTLDGMLKVMEENVKLTKDLLPPGYGCD